MACKRYPQITKVRSRKERRDVKSAKRADKGSADTNIRIEVKRRGNAACDDWLRRERLWMNSTKRGAGVIEPRLQSGRPPTVGSAC